MVGNAIQDDTNFAVENLLAFYFFRGKVVK